VPPMLEPASEPEADKVMEIRRSAAIQGKRRRGHWMGITGRPRSCPNPTLRCIQAATEAGARGEESVREVARSFQAGVARSVGAATKVERELLSPPRPAREKVGQPSREHARSQTVGWTPAGFVAQAPGLSDALPIPKRRHEGPPAGSAGWGAQVRAQRAVGPCVERARDVPAQIPTRRPLRCHHGGLGADARLRLHHGQTADGSPAARTR